MNDFFGQSAFAGAVLSLTAYFIGVRLKKRFRLAVFNPLLVAIVLTIGVLMAAKVEYVNYCSGAKLLSWLLTPATVCLAIPLYEQWSLLRKNAKAVLCSLGIGVVISLTTVWVLAAAMGLDHRQYVTFLPKSITTAIGMGVSQELGGYVTITVAVIIITGVLGNMLAPVVCRVFRITEPIAKGLAIGAASHAIGTARAMEMGEVEGAMSSLAIAVSGLLTVPLASLWARLL